MLEKARQKLTFPNFQMDVKSTSSASCDTGVEGGSGAWLATDYYYNYNVTAFLGPTCVEGIELLGRLSTEWDAIEFNFWRDYYLDSELLSIIQMSTSSAANLATNLVATLNLIKWHKISLLSCSVCVNDLDQNQGRIDSIKKLIKANGITILADLNVGPELLGNSTALAEIISPIKTQSRVIIAILGNTLASYSTFLRALELVGMDGEEFAPIVSVSTPNLASTIELPWLQTSPGGAQVVNAQLLELFDRTIVLVNDYYKPNMLQDFAQQMDLPQNNMSVLLLYAQLYESYWLYANAFDRVLQEAKINSDDEFKSVAKNGSLVRTKMQTQVYDGPFGQITLNDDSQRLAPFRVYIVQTNASMAASKSTGVNGLVDFLNVSLVENCLQNLSSQCLYMVSTLISGNLNLFDSLPPDVPPCGFGGELCDTKTTVIVVVSVIAVICLGLIVFLCFKRVKTGETSQMPWAIPANLMAFVEADYGGSSNMSIHSIQQPIDSKQNMNELLRTRQLATIDQGFVIVEGYRLKEKLTFDKRDMQWLFQMKQAIHDNINPFIGVCIDRSPNELLLIWRHCFRGTLSDLLFANKSGNRRSNSLSGLSDQDDRPSSTILDNNFKGAFVRDLIKGIDFIHSSNIGYHGGLTASQCLIDSHWILKVSGFGISRMLFKWRHSGMLVGRIGSPVIPNSELHYYAPELRNAIKSAVHTNKIEDLEFSNVDGQAQDMFSFGAILYEILFRKKIADVEDTVEAMNEAEESFGIFSSEAEAKLPEQPVVPTTATMENSDHQNKGVNSGNGTIHPDLISLLNRCFNVQAQQRPDANMARKITDATLKISGSLVDQMIKNMEQYTNNLENMVQEQTGRLEEEQHKAEQILLELLPKSVIDELRMGRRVEPKFYASVTIMYSDIVGFTSMCSESSPMEVVNLLNGMFRAFDYAISQHNAYKVETIGDAYMVASGVPIKMNTEHVREIAAIALMQREFLSHYEIPHQPGKTLHCRWGFNSGNVFTGVVGITAPRYCVFGTTVSIAAKMENSGVPDKIQLTLKSYQMLSEQFPEYKCTPRGGVRIDGVGVLLTYWLDECQGAGSESYLSARSAVSTCPPTPPHVLGV